MKKLAIIIILLITIGGFFSCEKEEGPVVTPESSVVLDSVGNYISVLAPEKANNVFTVLTWTPAKYNVDVIQGYRIEVDTAGNNFNDAVTVLNTDADSAAITVFQLNKALTSDLGLPPDTECSIEIRVGSTLGEKAPQVYSGPAEFTVTTYNPPWEPQEVFVHGEDSIMGSLLPVKDADGNVISGQYEGYVYIPQGGDAIQFGDQAGETIYGDENQNGPDTDVELNDPIAEDAAAIPVDSGYYQVTINTYDLNYDLYETAWGVIGSGIAPYDWSEDIDMTYHPDKDIWTVVVDAQSGEFKFRPNDLWDPLNYGDNGGDGIPEEYGTNIPIAAGSKKITLDLSEYPYSYNVEDAK